VTRDQATKDETGSGTGTGDGPVRDAPAGAPDDAAVVNYKIRDKDSFDAVTAGPRQVAGLYFYLQLDCLFDYAYRVAADFFSRPQLYVKVGRPTIAGKLAKLRARYGTDERIPSQEQRDAIFLPIFGQSGSYPANGQADFPRLRDELLNAAAAFAERVFDTGEEMLRERVRTTHRPFKDYLAGLQGDSLEWSRHEALVEIADDLAYTILRNPGVASVFGLSVAAVQEWPYTEDTNADKLVEQISKQLVVASNSHTVITREAISNYQRVALRGAEALATVIAFSEGGTKDELNLLITKCYTWASALRSLTGAQAGQVALMR